MRALADLGGPWLEVQGTVVMRQARRLSDYAHHPDPAPPCAGIEITNSCKSPDKRNTVISAVRAPMRRASGIKQCLSTKSEKARFQRFPQNSASVVDFSG